MTREIQRPGDRESCEEAKKFGGPYWDSWKHSLLDYLGVTGFPDDNTEQLLHNWWRLRMERKTGIIGEQQYNKEKNILFPPVEDGEDPLLDKNSFLSRAVRYITEKTAPSPQNGRNW